MPKPKEDAIVLEGHASEALILTRFATTLIGHARAHWLWIDHQETVVCPRGHITRGANVGDASRAWPASGRDRRIRAEFLGRLVQ